MAISARVLFAALLTTTIVHAEESPPVPLAPLPVAWGLMGNGGPNALPGSCEIGIDRQKSGDGRELYSVRCTNTVVPSFGGARSDIDTRPYRGKRVRVSVPDLSLLGRAGARADERFQPPPEKWLALGGQGFELCDVGVDTQLLKLGQRNLSIACSISANPTLRQAFAAAPWWGKRVRFSGWVKTEKVESPTGGNGPGGAGLFISASGTQSAVLSESITGTTEWQYRELVMDIPRNSQWIPLGLALNGRGQVWARDLKFEEVSGDTPVTPPLIR